jgi:hypothetical protein
VAKDVQEMSALLFGLLLGIGLAWGVPFVASRLLGERLGRRVVIGLFLASCVLFLSIVWFIYFANFDTQMVVIEAVFGVWGWTAGLFKLVLGYLVIRFARSKSVGGAGRVWHNLVEALGYVLIALGLLGLLGELFWTLISALVG